MEKLTTTTYDNVIFFDGVCGLCNGFIDFVMSVDKAQKFKFSPLQSEFAQNNLPHEMTANLDSVVLLKDGKSFRKSQAVIKILEEIGGIWKLVKIIKILPERMQNDAYDIVAQNRYNIFGKKETCRLPTPAERARFII